ncbi:MAG: hypothetical protein IKU29_05200 [Parabacteroides sp.]|nr:hypothetical protein [Parabacteroides sp.]
MKQLAIKGHKTRGNEVIEILKMLGGENRQRWDGKANSYFYIINSPYNNEIECLYDILTSEYEIFTIEEFLEKFPFKIGDRVQHRYATSLGSVYEIIKMEWEDDNVQYTISAVGSIHTSRCSAEYLKLWEIQEPKEEKRVYNKLNFNYEPAADTVELILGDYEIKIEGEKTYLVKKKPTYPKTYVECAHLLNCFSAAHIDGYKNELLEKFQELIICRDAYWKIVGEQMGLGKPWAPDWLNVEQDKYVLYTHNDSICSNVYVLGNNILAFPTAEMRDAFYENFKDLIEQCKELL